MCDMRLGLKTNNLQSLVLFPVATAILYSRAHAGEALVQACARREIFKKKLIAISYSSKRYDISIANLYKTSDLTVK